MNTDLSFDQIKFLIENGFPVKVETPYGMHQITDVYEKFSSGRKIQFSDGSEFIGSNSHLIYKGNNFTPLSSLNTGDIIEDKNYNTKTIEYIEEKPAQKWIDFSIDHPSETYIQSDIIHHNSGKSALVYTIMRYLSSKGLRGLVIVPNVGLIHQLYNDFDDYSAFVDWNVIDNVHKIFSGQDKNSNKNCYLSTWQSLYTIKDKSWFSTFDYVIIDEAHGVKATSLTGILENCINAEYRIGLTGTLDNIKANINTIIGLTGPINKLITTRELIDRNQVSNLKIKCLVLKYDKETSKTIRKYKYQEEIKFLITNPKRNAFIKNLTLSLDKNTIVLFNFVETHGKIIYEMIKNSKHLKGRNVYFIHGGVAGEERERIRQIIETETNAIIVASSGTMATGVSIKNLHNIVFAISGKSRIRNLQSIGRILRLHESKEYATLYDIVDNLSVGKHQNFTLNHFLERVKIYDSEQFDYKIANIPFNLNS
nr:MAG: ATP-dependent DNA helicase [Caudoviricetes sp.]